MLHRTLVAFAAAAAIGCLPMATNAFAGPHGHGGGGHAMAGHDGGGHFARNGGGHVARYGGNHYRGGYGGYGGYAAGYSSGPIYDSCGGYGYGYGGCGGRGNSLVGGLIDGVLGGYSR